MLYLLLFKLRDVFVGFNVFRYITFRTAFAALTALLISFILGPWLTEPRGARQPGPTLRAEGRPAALRALLPSVTLGPWLIERRRHIKLGQFIREEGPQSHQIKAGTPTMG